MNGKNRIYKIEQKNKRENDGMGKKKKLREKGERKKKKLINGK